MLYVYHINQFEMCYIPDDNLAFNNVFKLKEALSKYLSVQENQIMLLKDSQRLEDEVILSHYNVGLTDSNPIFAFTIPNRPLQKSRLPETVTFYDTMFNEGEDALRSKAIYDLRVTGAKQIYDATVILQRLCEPVSIGVTHHKRAWLSLITAGKNLEYEVKTKLEIFTSMFQDNAKLHNDMTNNKLLERLQNALESLISYRVPKSLMRKKSSRKLVFRNESFKRRRISSSSTGVPVMVGGDMSISDEEDHYTVGSSHFAHLENKVPSTFSSAQYQSQENLYSLLFAESTESILARARRSIFLKHHISEMFLIEKEKDFLQNYEAEMKKFWDFDTYFESGMNIQSSFKEFTDILEIQGRFHQKMANDQIWRPNNPNVSETARRQQSDLLTMKEKFKVAFMIAKRIMEQKDILVARYDAELKKFFSCYQKLFRCYLNIVCWFSLLNKREAVVETIDRVSKLPCTLFIWLSELLRRQAYAKSFKKWSEPLCREVYAVWSKEKEKREKFLQECRKFSFLWVFEDFAISPSKYAAFHPEDPDAALPQLSDADVKMLKDNWPPEYKHLLPPETDFDLPPLLQKIVHRTKSEKLVGCDDDDIYASAISTDTYVSLRTDIIQSRRRSVSEGEDFEQIVPGAQRPDYELLRQAEQNLEEKTTDYNKLELEYKKLVHEFEVKNARIHDQECELATYRSRITSLTQEADETKHEHCDKLVTVTNQLQEEHRKTMENLIAEKSNLDKEVHALKLENERLKSGQEDEIARRVEEQTKEKVEILKKEMERKKDEEISQCRSLLEAQKDIDYYTNFKEREKQLKEEYEKELAQIKSDLEKTKKEEIDEINRRSRMDIEGLRYRYRMMTTANLDRSPSESSLPDCERNELMDLCIHKTKLRELREEFDKKVSQELDGQKELYEAQLSNKESYYKEQREKDEKKIEKEQQLIFQRALEDIKKDKDELLESYRAKICELTQQTEDIEALKAVNEACNKKIRSLQSDIRRQFRITREQQKLQFTDYGRKAVREMTIEFLKLCGVDDDLLQRFGVALPVFPLQINTSINLCGSVIDTIAIFYWSEEHNAYKALMRGSLSLLDPSCHPFFGISDKPEENSPFYLAEIVRQEFSTPKRKGNRFNLDMKIQFFRVYARPPGSKYEPVERSRKHSMPYYKHAYFGPKPRRRTESEGDIPRLETFRSPEIKDDICSGLNVSGSPRKGCLETSGTHISRSPLRESSAISRSCLYWRDPWESTSSSITQISTVSAIAGLTSATDSMTESNRAVPQLETGFDRRLRRSISGRKLPSVDPMAIPESTEKKCESQDRVAVHQSGSPSSSNSSSTQVISSEPQSLESEQSEETKLTN